MAPQVDDIIRLCCEISAQKKIKVAVKEPVRGVMVAGSSILVGGLLGGPAGMAVGGAVGGLLGKWMSRGQFQPLPQILMELSPSQKQKLCNEIRQALGSSYYLNLISTEFLISYVMRDAELNQKVTSALIKYVTKELKVKVRY
ncbi:C19orf12-like protein [Oryzias melastigma]|uniref:C19orf12-like protein n=1 Tax=Oryzias melastigma TaxID=30732 RepID=A0A834FI92_ORYME|nr:C19orf12-like protein [Oryzias melastigma]